MDYNQILAKKEAALAFAKEQVAALEKQVTTLRESLKAASVQSEFELMLEKKTATVETGVQVFATNLGHVTLRQRNPKGSIRAGALGALMDGLETLDEIEASINKYAYKPVSRNSIRTLMMNLKRENIVISPADGRFRLVGKGEAPTDSRSVEASSASEAKAS